MTTLEYVPTECICGKVIACPDHAVNLYGVVIECPHCRGIRKTEETEEKEK